MKPTILAADAPNLVIVSSFTAGQICQRGAAIINGRVYRVTRDQNVGPDWNVHQRLSRRRATVQLCWDLANSC